MLIGQGITPFASKAAALGDPLTNIVNSYGFLNAWSSENLNISGTTTTAIDYLGEHDLVNPAAGNQPTYSSSDSAFNNKPSLTFNGTTDYLYKAVSDWRGSDSSGVFVGVYRLLTGTNIFTLSTSDETLDTTWGWRELQNSALFNFHLRSGGTSNQMRANDTLISDTNAHVISGASTGSAYESVVDGVNNTIAVVSGTDNGFFLDSISGRDNVAIGGWIRNTKTYANIGWCFSGYLPYVSNANIIALQNELKTHYGI